MRIQNSKPKTNFTAITCIENPGMLYEVPYKVDNWRLEKKLLSSFTDYFTNNKLNKIEPPKEADKAYKNENCDTVKLSKINDKHVINIDFYDRGLKRNSYIIDTVKMSKSVKKAFNDFLIFLDKID